MAVVLVLPLLVAGPVTSAPADLAAPSTSAERMQRGAAHLRRGEAAEALRAFRNVPAAYLLHDWAVVHGALAARALGRTTEAVDMLAPVTAKRAGGAWAAARDLEAELLEKAGRPAEAEGVLADLLAVHGKHRHRWRWRCMRARCLAAAGRPLEAGRLFLEVCRNAPRRRARREAFRRLAELWKIRRLPDELSAEERLAWASILREKGFEREGAAIVAELAAGKRGKAAAREAALAHARILWATKKREDALALVKRLARDKRADAEQRAAADEALADFDFARRHVTHAAQRLDRLGERAPKTASGGRAHWKASDRWRHIENWAAARASCRRLLVHHPKGFYAPFALLRAADCALRLGRVDEALPDLDRLLAGWPGHRLAPTARYLRMRLLATRPDGKEAAATARRALARTEPLDLYALLAALDEAGIPEAGGRLTRRGEVRDALLAERSALRGRGGWMAPPAELPAWVSRRIEILRRADLWEALVWELEERCRRFGRCYPLWNDLSRAHFRAGQWGDGIQVAESIDGTASDMDGFSPAHHLRNRYPKAFPALVTRHAAAHGIPPALAWAIAREESHFRPDICSWADARGLMQIMPATGKWLFELRKWPNWGLDRLWEPSTNVDLGCYYLARLAKGYADTADGEALTMAAYNGGPGNVRRWRAAFGDEPFHRFLEHVPLQETRLYVKKVVRAMLHYELFEETTVPEAGSAIPAADGSKGGRP